jgi:hypothetical protein
MCRGNPSHAFGKVVEASISSVALRACRPGGVHTLYWNGFQIDASFI